MPKFYWLLVVLLRNEGVSLNELISKYGFSRSTTLRDLKTLKTDFMVDLRSGSSILDGADKGYMLLDTGIINKDFLAIFEHAKSVADVEKIMRSAAR